MSPVRKITTQEVREAWMNLLVPTGAPNTFKFIDPETAELEFNSWLKAERKRVAEHAMKKERKRFLEVIREEYETCQCEDPFQHLLKGQE